MELEHKSVKEMWNNYLLSSGQDIMSFKKSYQTWHFCDNEKDADELAELVKQGIKRATTSLYCFYEAEGEALPKEGDLNIITDWNGFAKCVIQTKNVTIEPFHEVSEEFARTEGEGDKSLKYWREAHINAFNRGLTEYKMEFKVDMLVVCEEFEVVYQ